MMHIVHLESDKEIPGSDFILFFHILLREIHFHIGKTTCLLSRVYPFEFHQRRIVGAEAILMYKERNQNPVE